MPEEYTGIKFKVEFISKQLPISSLLNELKNWCFTFGQSKLAPAHPSGSAGNLSFRAEDNSDKFFITASAVDLNSQLIDSDFSFVEKCDFENRKVYAHGTRNPSSESMLHYAIYRRRKDVNAIFHGHNDLILTNASLTNIPVTTNEAPYGSMALVDSLMAIINKGDFLILRNHGFISLGTNMERAGQLACEYLKLSGQSCGKRIKYMKLA